MKIDIQNKEFPLWLTLKWIRKWPIVIATKNIDYNYRALEVLRAETSSTSVVIISKDGVKTLASEIRVHYRPMVKPGDGSTTGESVGSCVVSIIND